MRYYIRVLIISVTDAASEYLLFHILYIIVVCLMYSSFIIQSVSDTIYVRMSFQNTGIICIRYCHYIRKRVIYPNHIFSYQTIFNHNNDTVYTHILFISLLVYSIYCIIFCIKYFTNKTCMIYDIKFLIMSVKTG